MAGVRNSSRRPCEACQEQALGAKKHIFPVEVFFLEGLILSPIQGVALASFLPVCYLTIAATAATTLCYNGGLGHIVCTDRHGVPSRRAREPASKPRKTVLFGFYVGMVCKTTEYVLPAC